jgi:hypothetical protein
LAQVNEYISTWHFENELRRLAIAAGKEQVCAGADVVERSQIPQFMYQITTSFKTS